MHYRLRVHNTDLDLGQGFRLRLSHLPNLPHLAVAHDGAQPLNAQERVKGGGHPVRGERYEVCSFLNAFSVKFYYLKFIAVGASQIISITATCLI